MNQQKLIEIIRQGVAELDITLSSNQLEQIEHHLSEIDLFNDIYRLVNAKDEELAIKHVLDSFSFLPLLNKLSNDFAQPLRCADVGSGGGFPGIPLAIALEGSQWSLIERSGKRAGFLENAVASCNLYQRVSVINKDIKEVHDTFDIITFRAFASIHSIIKEMEKSLSLGGYICAYKGKFEPLYEELQLLGEVEGDQKEGIVGEYTYQIHPLHVPLLDAQRHMLLLQKR
jgi:16S rRNA (guanine527-N7)-methyltransferase